MSRTCWQQTCRFLGNSRYFGRPKPPPVFVVDDISQVNPDEFLPSTSKPISATHDEGKSTKKWHGGNSPSSSGTYGQQELGGNNLDVAGVSVHHERISLRDKLFAARVEWPVGENRYFIPNDKLQQLLNPDSILMELKRCKLVFPDDDIQRDVANNISRSAPRLFAILVCLKSGHLILKFLEEEIDDTHLPFERTDKRGNSINFKLCSKKHPKYPIKCMENWDQGDIINFGRDQWCVLAPVFDRGEDVLHQELDDNCILPFLEDNERSDKAREGGFSSVWEIVIHPAHQKLYHSTNPENTLTSLALKRLHSTKEEDFKLEVEMLKAFSRSRHPHLVRLLATYRHKRRYFLLFPWAKSNLRKYWEDTPRPDFSEATVLWSLRQCKAIASGLHMIHEYRSTQDSIKARSLQPPPASSGDPAMEDDDRLYGRHGDIKPENILWSVEEVLDDSQCSNEEGVLLIADFGLMDFHNRLSRSQVHPDKITGSPTYEPPELKLHRKISRAYDIWSLGCVYLEFITWLVGGWAELDRFPKAREVAGWNGISDDTFFTIIEFGTQPRAIVRGGVQAWMKDLHEKPRCSAFIHDFLNLVSEHMLVVNPKHRIHCGPLNERLSSMLAKAKANPLYLTEGRPTRHSSACAQQYSPLSRTLSESSDNNPSPAEGTPLPKRPSVVSSLDELAHSSPEIVPSIYIESPPSSPQLL